MYCFMNFNPACRVAAGIKFEGFARKISEQTMASGNYCRSLQVPISSRYELTTATFVAEDIDF